jgi:DNA-binding CsgD family transcriptional regulator
VPLSAARGHDDLHPSPIVIPLTPKESEVLGYLAELLTTEEIAAAMFVSVNTIRSHVRSILRKLGVGRTQRSRPPRLGAQAPPRPRSRPDHGRANEPPGAWTSTCTAYTTGIGVVLVSRLWLQVHLSWNSISSSSSSLSCSMEKRARAGTRMRSTCDLDPERLVLLQRVREAAKLRHHLVGRVEGFDVPFTLGHVV